MLVRNGDDESQRKVTLYVKIQFTQKYHRLFKAATPAKRKKKRANNKQHHTLHMSRIMIIRGSNIG
jgi:hypothetical protein